MTAPSMSGSLLPGDHTARCAEPATYMSGSHLRHHALLQLLCACMLSGYDSCTTFASGSACEVSQPDTQKSGLLFGAVK